MGFWHGLPIFMIVNICFAFGKLTGDHICLKEKLFRANVTEHYLKDLTIRQYRWCYNIPPRCSFYTTRQINATRIVEKNQTKTVEECCINFVEKDDHCVSSCPSCVNGICENGHCNCFAGFKGNSCELECGTGEWGPNCSRICECSNQDCDSISGICIETSTRIVTTPTPKKTTTVPIVFELTESSEISRVTTKPVTSLPTSIVTTVDSGKTAITTPVASTTKQQITNINDVQLISDKSTDTNNINEKTATQNTDMKNVVNGSHIVTFLTTKNSSSTTVKPTQVTQITTITNNVTFTTITNRTVTQTKNNIPYSTLLASNVNKGSITSAKPISEDSGMTSAPVGTEKNKYTTRTFSNGSIATNEGLLIPVEIEYGRLKSDVYENRSVSKEDYLNREISEKKVSFNDFALFGITVLLALMIVVVILVVNILRKRKVEQTSKTEANHQVAVFSATIYHSPVPEIVEYEYDHPPSSSYRTTSVFRTQEVEKETSPENESEPIYDEIPQQIFEPSSSSIPPTSIYINTCESTKF